MHLFLNINVPFHHGMAMLHSHLIMCLALSCIFLYVLFHVHLHFDDVSFLNGAQNSVVGGKNFPR